MAKKVLPLKIKKATKQYLEILKKDGLPIQKAFLFGSWAKGRAKKWSDIDICIVSSKFKNSNQALDYLWERRIVNKNIHLETIGFHPKDFVNENPLVWEIKKTGILIKL